MIRIGICDDQIPFAKQVEGLVMDYCRNHRVGAKTSLYGDSGMLLYDIQEKAFFDLFFLDIEMPGMTGMELAGAIRKALPQALVIFVTSHAQYAIKAYELSVFRYIPKAKLEECLPLALSDALGIMAWQDRECYMVETPKKIQKVRMSDILYIYKEKKYSHLVLREGEVLVRKPLGQVLDELARLGREEFLMVERGYIANLYHVDRMEGGLVVLSGGQSIPVSSSHQKEIREAITQFWRKRL